MTLSSLLLQRLDPERAHELAIRALAGWTALGTPGARNPARFSRLATNVAGLSFPNPVGIAAGLDKDARGASGLFALGAGGVEVGTLTPLPQAGNPRPRLFRLSGDGAVVNRYGFNNQGLAAGVARAAVARRRGPLGINVGANKDAADRVADYRAGVEAAVSTGRANYVAINISSPNTPGLRDLQQGTALAELLAACNEARGSTPLFLKVAPDLDPATLDGVARASMEARIGALVIGNTTVSRPAGLTSPAAAEAGGLSGRPLAPLAHQRLRDFRTATGGALPLVAAGGIGDAAEAYARLRSGASLVQLYTALAYGGPGLVWRIVRDLDALLVRDGHANVAEVVGTN